MAEQGRTTLKGYFETGDIPSDSNFGDLIDSVPNITDDSGVQYAKVLLSSAEILQLNSSPKELVAAPGVGKALVAESVMLDYTFVSAAYATDTTLEIHNGTTGIGQMGEISSGILGEATDKMMIRRYDYSESNHEVRENESLTLTTE